MTLPLTCEGCDRCSHESLWRTRRDSDEQFLAFLSSYWIVIDFQSCDLKKTILRMFRLTNVSSEIYIFILISRHGDELCFGKDEGIYMIDAVVEELTVAMKVLCCSNNVQSRNIFMHGIQHDLNRTVSIISLRQRERLTCPFWSVALFVSFSLLNDNGCFISWAPVELLSGWG